MDLLKLLNSLEDLVVEVALWLVLLPRTLFAAIFRPVTLASYFDQMQPIPVEERDDKYLSPVLFWILIAPVSLILTLAGADKEAFALYGDGWQERMTTSVLMLLGPPLGFALASLLIRREAVTKSRLAATLRFNAITTPQWPYFSFSLSSLISPPRRALVKKSVTLCWQFCSFPR